METQTSGKAIASFTCSLVGLFVCVFVGQIIGIVLGHQAKREIQFSEGRLCGDGLATAGIVIGWIGIGLDILLILFWALIIGSTNI